MSDFSGKIHNIQVNDNNIAQLVSQIDDPEVKELIRKAYKEGHRDARHKAVETLIPFESVVDDLVKIVRAIDDEPLINLHALGNVPSTGETLMQYKRVESN